MRWHAVLREKREALIAVHHIKHHSFPHTIISSYAKQQLSSEKNKNSHTNETFTFNVILSTISFAEDGLM